MTKAIWLTAAVSFFFLAAAALFASGCTVGKPFRGPGFEPGRGVTLEEAGDTVLVAITHTVLNRDRMARRAFGRHLWKVVDAMPEQPGLVGYSVRRELFGDEAWTLSVWVDEASLEGFVRSEAHRNAIAVGGRALESVRFARIELEAEELPLEWPRALELLDARSSEGPEPEAAR